MITIRPLIGFVLIEDKREPFKKQNYDYYEQIRKVYKNIMQKQGRCAEQWVSLDDPVKINRFYLNQEFKDRFLIKDCVQYRWYPSCAALPVSGHVDLEMDGYIFNSFLGRFEKRKSTNKENSNSYFHRISLHLTITEHEKLSLTLKRANLSFNHTCAGGAAHLLAQHTNISIPFPLLISPLLSRIYLQISKMWGSNRIGKTSHKGEPDLKILLSLPSEAFQIFSVYLGLEIFANIAVGLFLLFKSSYLSR